MSPSAAIASCILAMLSVSALASDSDLSTGVEDAAPAVILPGTGYAVVPGIFSVDHTVDFWDPFQDAVVAWLSFEFGLPRIEVRAAISFVPAARMASIRFRDVPSDRWPGESEIVAVYDTEARTVYLPEDWTGRTPAELSVLVHELVHHVQSVGGIVHECLEASEKTAYVAQERFLGMFGRDLETDFQIDGFTVLACTNCLY
jgi:hypothetical protein